MRCYPFVGLFKRRKADPTITQVVQNLSLAVVTLEGQISSLKHQWRELEEHVDKRFRSMRGLLGAAASARSAGGEGVDGAHAAGPGEQGHVHRAPPPVQPAGVSGSKAELLERISRGDPLT